MKNLKKILSVFALVAIIVSSFALMTACGGNGGEDENEPCTVCVDEDVNGKCDVCGGDVEIPEPDVEKVYTVAVKDTNGAKVVGAKVKLITAGNKESEIFTTDENGETNISFEAIAYVKVAVTEVPDGYIKPDSEVMFDDGATEVTVTVAIDTRTTYKVTVVDEAGNGISGIMVGICDDSGCKTPVATDENGVSLQKLNISGEAKVQLMSISGYEVVSHELDEGYIHFAEGETEITITLKAI